MYSVKKYKGFVLHENMTQDEIRRLEGFLNKGHHIFKEIRLSDTSSLLILEYYEPMVHEVKPPKPPAPPPAPDVEYIKEGQTSREES